MRHQWKPAIAIMILAASTGIRAETEGADCSVRAHTYLPHCEFSDRECQSQRIRLWRAHLNACFDDPCLLSSSETCGIVKSGTSGDDSLYGSGGHDKLLGADGNDTLWGKWGNDELQSGPGNDWLHGGVGDDWLRGGRGNDKLEGSYGSDQLRGGAGDDTLDGGAGDDRLWGGKGNDLVEGWGGEDRLHGGPGDDWMIGGPDSDYLQGGPGSDVMVGGCNWPRLPECFAGGSGHRDTFDLKGNGDGDHDIIVADSTDDIMSQFDNVSDIGIDQVSMPRITVAGKVFTLDSSAFDASAHRVNGADIIYFSGTK